MGCFEDREEVKRKHLERFGPDLGLVYHRLWNECAQIHMHWHQFEELFGENEARVEIMNASAPHFFSIVQDILWNDVLLHLCRLTDPPEMGGKKNLSVQAVPDRISDAKLRSEVEALVEDAVETCEFARDWRHRHIAHRDLPLALNDETADPLEPASRNNVNEALEALRAVLTVVARGFGGDAQFGEPVIGRGALSMLHTLRYGLEWKRKRREALQEGTYDADEWEPETPI